MKTMQNRLSAGLVGLAVIILLVGGCKKDLAMTEEGRGPKLSNLTLTGETTAKKKVLR